MSLINDLRTVVGVAGKPSQRLMFLSVVLNIATACFDAIGIGAVVPFIALLSIPDLFVRYPMLVDWVPLSLQHDRAALVVSAAAFLALIYVLRAATSLASAWAVAQMQGMLTRDVCRVLFLSYIRQSWAYHLEKGPAYFSTRLSPSVNMANGTIQGLLQFVVEALTALLVLLVVLWVNPLAASISVLVVGLPATLIFYLIKDKTRRIGRETQEVAEQSAKVMLSGTAAIKELKVLGRERHFQEQYYQTHEQWRPLIARYTFYRSAPRAILELGAVTAVLVMSVVLARQGRMDQLVPVLGLYVAAAFRLLPAIHQLLSSLTMIQHNRSGLAMVASDIRLLPPPDAEQAPSHQSTVGQQLQSIEIRDLCFRYRAGLPLVLNRISLTIHSGETIGIVGSTGAGKSTLIDLLLGLLLPSDGTISIDGEDITKNLRGWQNRIGHVPQVIYLVNDTIRRNVCLGLADDDIDDGQVWKALSAAQLASFVRSLPQGLDTAVGERGVKLSGGQRQRIGIARALYHQPEVLVLDEATSALDNATESEFMCAIEGLHGRKTIILVAHRLTTLRNCNRIFRVEEGRLVQIGAYDDLVAKSGHLAESH